MKTLIKSILHKFGIELLKYPSDTMVRQQMALLKKYHIEVIFDIGANVGQYAERIRSYGYKGKIVSFEPLPEAFAQLKQKAKHDSRWEVVNKAIGDFNGQSSIHISENSYSSSLLEILPAHIESAPQAVYVEQVPVMVATLDSLIDNYVSATQQVFVKIDTQGFERQVLEGALQSLNKIIGFQMELSLLPLYEGETLFFDMIELMKVHGYKLMIVEGGYQHYKTGEMQQVEGYFYRRDL